MRSQGNNKCESARHIVVIINYTLIHDTFYVFTTPLREEASLAPFIWQETDSERLRNVKPKFIQQIFVACLLGAKIHSR